MLIAAGLNGAGFAPAYRLRPVCDRDIVSAEAARRWMLERHDPYLGLVLNRHWHLLRLNRLAALGSPVTLGSPVALATARRV